MSIWDSKTSSLHGKGIDRCGGRRRGGGGEMRGGGGGRMETLSGKSSSVRKRPYNDKGDNGRGQGESEVAPGKVGPQTKNNSIKAT